MSLRKGLSDLNPPGITGVSLNWSSLTDGLTKLLKLSTRIDSELYAY